MNGESGAVANLLEPPEHADGKTRDKTDGVMGPTMSREYNFTALSEQRPVRSPFFV
jgi:hypothetical protein